MKPEDIDLYDYSNPRFTKVACPHKEYTFDEQIGFKKQLNQLKPDLVHFGMVQQPVLYKGKTITTMHDLTTVRFRNPTKNALIFSIKQQVYKWVNKKVAKKSVAIITPSEYVKRDVANFTSVDPNKITVTYEAAGQIKDAPEPLIELDGKKFIMYLGRPQPHKNLWRLIQAFEQLSQQHPDLYLTLAGKPDKAYGQIQDKVKEAGINGVVFTGSITEGQLRWMYENCAVYVFPSLSEGFGLPGLEAMSHGAPVVSSNATCLPEIYGDAPMYFNPLDVNSIALSINKVLGDDALRQTMIEAGRQQAAKYSWQRMAEQTLEIYNKSFSK